VLADKERRLAYLGAVVVLLLPATRVARRDEGSHSVLGANRRVLDIVTAAVGIARLLRGDSAQKARRRHWHSTDYDTFSI
jgi:dTDP-4-amino-4,6-dideoxygalactose transaminase